MLGQPDRILGSKLRWTSVPSKGVVILTAATSLETRIVSGQVSQLPRGILANNLYMYPGRHIDLMVSALVSRSSVPISSPGLGHCVMFLGETLHSHSASLNSGV